jgi:hypothetical protein
MSEGHGDAYIRTISAREAGPALRDVYRLLWGGNASRPPVYATKTGDVPNIVKCHSLDPEGLRLAFSMSRAVHWDPLSLPWARREMMNTVISRANNCFY